MGLQKSLDTEYGITLNYFKIIATNANYDEKIGNVVLAGYVNYELRLEKNKYVKMFNYPLIGDDFDKVFNIDKLTMDGVNAIKLGYEHVKETDIRFTDAVDLID